MRSEVQTAALGGGATWRVIMLVVMGLLGAAVLIALIVTLGNANRQRDRALELQAHSYDVMILARTLSGTIAQSEASLGRYVISGDKQLGQLYFDEWLLAGTQIDRLDRITNDNPEQQPRVDRLRTAYDSRGRELSLTALNTSYGKNGQALARYYQARKSPTLAEINTTLDTLIARERALLDDRTATALGSVERSSWVAGVLAVFGVLIVLGAILLGWFTIRAVGDRAVAQADAELERERADELTAAVATATAELRVQEAKLRQIQKMEAVGQLTGGIAHDFNNMLAVVLGGLELARRSVAADPLAARRHIDSATEGANRAAALTRRLLAFSREDSLKAETIDAAALVAGMSDLLDRTLGDAIMIIVRDDAAGGCVRADRVQLENAVLNLAVNARDAMNGRGMLTVATGTTTLAAEQVGRCAAGDYVTITVRDDGCGMAPDVAERVFEPFFTTKEVGKGTGLGLSQIFALVQQLHGEVGIVSAPGEGTTVTLYLPRAAALGTLPLPPVPMVAVDPIAPSMPETLHILVVEDDPRVLAATTGALEEIGHHPIGCDDPLAAPALLAANPAIGLIISDVLMPRQTGPEMIAALSPLYPHIAVLFVTGFAGEVNVAQFGGHEVLRKPFTLNGLERAVVTAMTADRRAAADRIAAE
ncbi:ATP-binding protein [Sphingomonas sp. PP-CC-3A-396]|uniref:ATP-binding protein n=1 Tax=Sphingomonas sp. PP-CC-3A-396 TaxID=2135655 RepID=UPI00104E4C25|nr:ATP-binding protein [Sphingomonas sp. PP-CC-3A-396]TCQ09568.1 phospho-acceptor domain-containing protein [Sphingomonas sp. PP-CC-3A-396]